MAQPPRLSSGESHWLLSTAGRWTEEDEKQWKREQHRENMVHFRRKKKAQQAQLRAQHRELELRLQQLLAGQRRALARASARSDAAPSAAAAAAAARVEPVDRLQTALDGLVLEREDLRRENLALRERVALHRRMHALAAHEANVIAAGAEPDPRLPRTVGGGADARERDGSGSDSSASASASASSRASRSPTGSPGLAPGAAASLDPTLPGHRVFFASGAPSFHYHPLSQERCAAIKLQYDVLFAARPVGEHVGSMLGWRVERAPLERRPELGGALLARAWYSKRVRCSPGGARAAADELAADSWPTLVEPALWAKIHAHTVDSELLQVVDADTYVLARDLPAPAPSVRHARYLNLVQRGVETNAFNQRVISCAMLVATSPANTRSQEAEREPGVLWVRFGGAVMSIVELDGETLEVVYEHCACSQSARHAQQQLVDWGSIAVRWEQLVLPSRLLCF